MLYWLVILVTSLALTQGFLSVNLQGSSHVDTLTVGSLHISESTLEACTLGQISFTTARGHVFCADVAGSPTWLSVADVAKTESIKEIEADRYLCPGSLERPVGQCSDIPHECLKEDDIYHFVNYTANSIYSRACGITQTLDEMTIIFGGFTSPGPSFVDRSGITKIYFPDNNSQSSSVTVTAPIPFKRVSGTVTISLIPGGSDHPDFNCETVVKNPLTWSTKSCATSSGSFAFGVVGENLLPFPNTANFISTSYRSHTWSVDRSYTAEQLKLHFLSEQAGSGGNAERYDLVMELKFE